MQDYCYFCVYTKGERIKFIYPEKYLYHKKVEKIVK